MRRSSLRSGTRVCERELGALRVHELAGQAEGLVELHAGDVGLRAEVRIAHDIEVRKASEAERPLKFRGPPADSMSKMGVGVEARVFDDLKAGEEGADEGGLVLAAVRAGSWAPE